MAPQTFKITAIIQPFEMDYVVAHSDRYAGFSYIPLTALPTVIADLLQATLVSRAAYTEQLLTAAQLDRFFPGSLRAAANPQEQLVWWITDIKRVINSTVLPTGQVGIADATGLMWLNALPGFAVVVTNYPHPGAGTFQSFHPNYFEDHWAVLPVGGRIAADADISA